VNLGALRARIVGGIVLSAMAVVKILEGNRRLLIYSCPQFLLRLYGGVMGRWGDVWGDIILRDDDGIPVTLEQ